MNQRATEYDLNKSQLEQLIDMYIDTVVDSMIMKDLVDYVKTDQYNFIDKLSEFEVYEEIKYTLDDEMLEEFITTIKGE